MIYVIATVELSEGGKEKYLAELKRVTPAVLKEKGCLAYGPTVDVPTGIPIQVPQRGQRRHAHRAMGECRGPEASPHPTALQGVPRACEGRHEGCLHPGPDAGVNRVKGTGFRVQWNKEQPYSPPYTLARYTLYPV